MFDKALYLKEMKKMVDEAINRLQAEKPSLSIYTVSIWTDPNAAMSSINFDSKENSLAKVEKANEWSIKYYEQYLAEGDLEQAELFKPINGTRIVNPADFLLRDFEQIKNRSFPANWEGDTDGKCWKHLNPALTEVGDYAFLRIKNLNVENGFELAVNSEQDWYDKIWQ
jgi:hypothetical protein